MAELETGAKVAGHYVIVSLLGQGGMGAVYRARDERTDALVAIKVLREARGDLAVRFIREARIASALVHPNIARVVEVLELDDGTPAIVMELLQGESLGARLARSGKLEAGFLARVFTAVVSAMKAAHERGVVHRDLKPDNIFLCEDGTVKVFDFGIARVTADAEDPAITVTPLTETGQILGTPQYMAPEQIFGEKDVDARADIWSLGVILYQTLAGVRPFDGANPGQVFKAIALDPPTPLEERAPNAPRELARLVSRMLVHARSDRLSDLDEVTEALERLSTNDVGEAPTVLADAVPKPRARRLVLIALGFAVIGTVMMVATRTPAPTSTAPPVSPDPAPLVSTAPSPSTSDTTTTITSAITSAAPPIVAKPPSAAVRPSAPADASAPPPDAGARPNRSGPLKRDEF